MVEEAGYFATMFGGQQPDPTLRAAPRGNLGPRYDITYVVPGPNNTNSKVHGELYPYAKPWPVGHMRAGQTFWNGQRTRGGWIRAHQTLRTTLVSLGLPKTAPSLSASGLSAGTWAGIASAGAFGLLAFGSIAVRRRPRRHEA